MSESFEQRLREIQHERQSHVCIGIDPDDEKWPEGVDYSPGGLLNFATRIVEATAKFACVFKPNLGFWAAIGAENELAKLIRFIKHEHGLPVILDAKYGDIGRTAEKYARAAFERYGADAVTVNAYLGTDTLVPFLKWGPKHAILVLSHTSNEGAREFQEAQPHPFNVGLFVIIAAAATKLKTPETAAVGIVMGATFPDQLKELDGNVPDDCLMLIPGIGTQKGDLKKTLTNAGKYLYVINSSSGIIHASRGRDFAEVAAKKAEELRDQINKALVVVSAQSIAPSSSPSYL
ncbi:MAG: orotidine 5'-phosphate decarboxylase [Candidatus Buchananbacteria bacterium RIFCSPHIGHO2_01_FULL_39_14]|uniref:Orotidine-5'-phosphate decarboxylase n=1 Tax=Candidatus Buchananbacteria bacterium RIFCSPHIGHO2_01_FULL_39_14 TaxID=1797532 RepID=A0A1G1XXQ3_9BACT|nr:MAG: orotidine 5'-phosphate decarboxylase [Candidatus Buchananbacteria bacterium RIFCSPHIGHO2_01_FULL_39_14]OGY49452.1 MAG: orotidine 5'-phosphate decarboxylase [Candidatus Buchananbacteria bacterium RIFCSPHIGHO2_02_FULL_39_17]